MAYDKHTWTCHEPITAEKLNHIEEGIANAGGDCNCGYECTEGLVTLTEESVTTTTEGNYAFGELSYSQYIDADSITVTFDGVEYECMRTMGDGYYYYGAPWNDSTQAYDWSEYPFAIESTDDGEDVSNTFTTEIAGTYTIKIEVEEETITTTPCFDKARGYSCGEAMGTLTEESVTTTAQGNYNQGGLSYSQFIDADSITVTFNGVEYECPRIVMGSNNAYGGVGQGGPDFSEYPFAIMSISSDANILCTQTAGTYTIKIEGMQEAVTTTQCFEKAVRSTISPLVVEADISPGEATTRSPSTLSASAAEIAEAMTTRGVVVKDPYGILYSVLSVTDATATIAIGVYNSTTQQTDFSAFCYTNNNWDSLQYPPTGVQ